MVLIVFFFVSTGGQSRSTNSLAGYSDSNGFPSVGHYSVFVRFLPVPGKRIEQTKHPSDVG